LLAEDLTDEVDEVRRLGFERARDDRERLVLRPGRDVGVM
jgi:hypothetical protein